MAQTALETAFEAVLVRGVLVVTVTGVEATAEVNTPTTKIRSFLMARSDVVAKDLDAERMIMDSVKEAVRSIPRRPGPGISYIDAF